MTDKWIFATLKIEQVKYAVKRIGQRFETKGNFVLVTLVLSQSMTTTSLKRRFKMYNKTFVEYSKNFKTAKRYSLSRLTKPRKAKDTGFL